jgi:hypothetical protein
MLRETMYVSTPLSAWRPDPDWLPIAADAFLLFADSSRAWPQVAISDVVLEATDHTLIVPEFFEPSAYGPAICGGSHARRAIVQQS